LIAALGQIFLRINAPGTPGAAVKSNVSHGIGINPTRFSASTVVPADKARHAFYSEDRNVADYVTRRFNVSSARLSEPLGLDLR
jgi:hypothetical protein